MSYLQKPMVLGVIALSLSASVIGLAWHHKKTIKNNQSRFRHFTHRKHQKIAKDKIILAFDPENLFFVFSQEKIQGYKPLKQKSHLLPSFMFKKNRSKGCCYRQLVSAKLIRNLMKRLSSLPNVQMVICTKLDEDYCNQILQNIGIMHLFPEDKRFFIKNNHKSAEQIDEDTGRVIIITANKQDHKDEIMSSHHNLILSLENQQMDQNLLTKLQQYLQRLTINGRTDSLHEEMYHLAIEMDLPLYNHQSLMI